ncbi:MAG: excinuclease ABC subunit UvrC [Oscillospiraceae bacterium]|nr:excinuclease ABC subunit UvrC [Oscillospiraceae bacterium]
MTDLKQKALSLPLVPGVYIMMDEAGAVLYVGKAKALKNRVCQYFQDMGAINSKTATMMSLVADFDVIVADSEFEALMLESSLIKHHKPRFNIKLKDDKGYPFIRLPSGEDYPRFAIVGKWKEDGARYFGPYGGRFTARNVIAAVSGAFKLPVCGRKFPRDIGRERPCLQHHMGRCMAPCRGDVTPSEYQECIRQAVGVLEGKYLDMASEITRDMEAASEAMMFEKAAALRDRRAAIVGLGQKQKVVSTSMADTDVVGYFAGEAKTCVAVLHFIGGALLDRDTAVLGQALSDDPADMVADYVKQFYYTRISYPRHVLLPCALEDQEAVAQWLSKLAGHPVGLITPRRGDRKKLVDMAASNARELAVSLTTKEERISALLTALQGMLSLDAPPRRIEAFDISHTGGGDTVGAMAVFRDGEPLKGAYRRFAVKTQREADDYHAMGEVVGRRFRRYREGERGFSEGPDLLLIDGGAAHAATAENALRELELSFPVYGMVKDSRHRTRALVASDGREVGLTGIPALFALIGRIQEEAHRFAISFHHERHGKSTLTSRLDAIPGVGKARREALLRSFKTMKAMSQASVEELSQVVPANVASAVREALQKQNGSGGNSPDESKDHWGHCGPRKVGGPHA